MSVTIEFLWDEGADTSLPAPSYETAGAAGADVRANFPDKAGVDLPAGGRLLIPTGLRVAIPQGFEIQVRPRSGLALKHGVTCLNTPGTIDSDYRGPLGVILFNSSDTTFHVGHGDRIAQLVVAPVVQGNFSPVSQLSDTARGASGFGSTGTA